MSEPVSNAAAENVLASIRRLVSEEKRPLGGPDAAGAAARPDPVDKLVLTPSLRVGAPEAGSGPDDTTRGCRDDDDRAADGLADAAGDAESGEAPFTNVEDDGVVDDMAPVLRLDAAVRLTDEAGPTTADADVGGESAETVTTGGEPGDAPPSTPLALESDDRSDAGSGDEAPAGGEERAIDRTQGPERDRLDIDETALRELVGDIVRQELQGPLGERITRNVRKLVRREILRALASKDFE